MTEEIQNLFVLFFSAEEVNHEIALQLMKNVTFYPNEVTFYNMACVVHMVNNRGKHTGVYLQFLGAKVMLILATHHSDFLKSYMDWIENHPYGVNFVVYFANGKYLPCAKSIKSLTNYGLRKAKSIIDELRDLLIKINYD